MCRERGQQLTERDHETERRLAERRRVLLWNTSGLSFPLLIPMTHMDTIIYRKRLTSQLKDIHITIIWDEQSCPKLPNCIKTPVHEVPSTMACMWLYRTLANSAIKSWSVQPSSLIASSDPFRRNLANENMIAHLKVKVSDGVIVTNIGGLGMRHSSGWRRVDSKQTLAVKRISLMQRLLGSGKFQRYCAIKSGFWQPSLIRPNLARRLLYFSVIRCRFV